MPVEITRTKEVSTYDLDLNSVSSFIELYGTMHIKQFGHMTLTGVRCGKHPGVYTWRDTLAADSVDWLICIRSIAYILKSGSKFSTQQHSIYIED